MGRSAALVAAAYLIAAGATVAFWDVAFHMFPFTLFFATAAVTATAGHGRAGVAVAALGTTSVVLYTNDTGPSVLIPGAVLVGVTALIAHLACARRRDASALAAERERLRRQVERLRLLSDAAGRLLGGGSPETTYPALFEQVSAGLGLDTYFHYSVDPAGDSLRLESWAGVPDETARAMGRLAFGEAVCGVVAATCRPIVLEDVQHSEHPRAAVLKPLGIRAYACHPLMAGDRLLGTLSFGLRDRDRFDAEELGLLQTICYYVSAAADRARMLTEAKDRAVRLAEGQERLGMALELADLGTWDLDPATGEMRWCERCRAAFGLPPDAPVGYTTFLAHIHAEDRERVRRANQDALGPDGPREYDTEYRVVRPDGAVRWVAAMGRALPAGESRRLIGTVLDVTTRKEHDRRAAVIEERGRMAREIHDTLAQALAGIILHLEAADQAIDHRPDAVRERLAEARTLARASLAEARRSVWAFRPQALEGRDLGGALHQLAHQSAGRSGVRVEFTATGTPAALAADVEDNLLRVAQEALANALRHAHAETITVELEYTPEGVRLRVYDNGTGFAPSNAHGFGLVSMRERAQRIGGELTVASQAGVGTDVTLFVPVGRSQAGGPG